MSAMEWMYGTKQLLCINLLTSSDTDEVEIKLKAKAVEDRERQAVSVVPPTRSLSQIPNTRLKVKVERDILVFAYY